MNRLAAGFSMWCVGLIAAVGTAHGQWLGPFPPDNRMVLPNGPVAIGHSTPFHTLDVRGSRQVAIYGLDSTPTSSGTSTGVRGESVIPGGFGVTGFSSATSGGGVGVLGRSPSPAGYGIVGFTSAPSGRSVAVYGDSRSSQGIGVFGLASSNSGTAVGVYGYSASPAGYAGFFDGGRNYFSGPVGFGAVNPTASLHVKGTVRLEGLNTTTTNTRVLTMDAQGHVRFRPFEHWDGGPGTPWVQYDTNYGGVISYHGSCMINTTNTEYARDGRLVVRGRDAILVLSEIGDEGARITWGERGDTYIEGVYGRRLRINTRRLGIDRYPTVNELELEGNASKTVAGSWLAISDARIKTDVADLQNALGIIKRIRPVGFRYTDAYLIDLCADIDVIGHRRRPA